jgi:hypothetical protein
MSHALLKCVLKRIIPTVTDYGTHKCEPTSDFDLSVTYEN